MSDLRKELKELVDASGWSQERCATAIGVSRQHLNALLQGKKEVSRDRVDLLKYRLLDQQPAALVPRTPGVQESRLEYRTDTERLARMLEHLRVIDPTGYAAAKTIVERLEALANSATAEDTEDAVRSARAADRVEDSRQAGPPSARKGLPSGAVYPHPKMRPERTTEDQP